MIKSKDDDDDDADDCLSPGKNRVDERWSRKSV